MCRYSRCRAGAVVTRRTAGRQRSRRERAATGPAPRQYWTARAPAAVMHSEPIERTVAYRSLRVYAG